MQGVNVVARWIDPASGQPSGASVATSVSGFLFHGNAGNPATGFTDSTGQRFDRFGSDDPAIEGFFDLAGLEIPNGTSSAQYQLTVEPVDPTWSQLVGPYGPWQVQPSGTAQPIIVTTSLGSDTAQDILMQNRDRKSTRLNSSHGYISYAVFCLKKKTPYKTWRTTRYANAPSIWCKCFSSQPTHMRRTHTRALRRITSRIS